MKSKMASEERRASTSCAALLTEEEKLDWQTMAAKLGSLRHWSEMSEPRRFEIIHNMAAARIARNERRAEELEQRVADLGGRMVTWPDGYERLLKRAHSRQDVHAEATEIIRALLLLLL